jgi:hypothetical protein
MDPNYLFKSSSAFIFCLNHFLEARARNVKKTMLVFWSLGELGILLSRFTDL